MPSVTVSVDEDVATRQSPAYAAGLGDHLPVGYWSGARYRSAIRFDKPAGWTAWTSITKATLTFYTSDFNHVGPRNSSIYIRRCTTGNDWTKGAGTQDCESGFSSGNNTQFADLAAASTDQVSFSSGTSESSKKSIIVTALVRTYWGWDNKPMFIFDPVDTDDYAEFWSNNSPSNTYDPKLIIEYEVASPPSAPTLSAPVSGELVTTQTPTFSWVHNATQSDPQTSAEVTVYAADSTTVVGTQTVAGAGSSLTWPTNLPRGVAYFWSVRTADVSGYGALAAKKTFTVKGPPTVTIAATRVMKWSNGRPRLEVSWTTDQPQGTYRVQVTTPAFDSGPQNGALQTYLLDTVDVQDNVAANVTVTVSNTDAAPLTGSASRSFTPRYGLTVHRRDLGTTPVTSWVGAEWQGSMPVGSDIRVQYGSSPTAVAAPAAWLEDITQAPLDRYVFYRVWLIPSATAGPSFDKMVITSTTGVVIPLTMDKWSTTKGAESGLVAPWVVSDKEYVYGTRSAKADMTTAGATSSLYSQPIILKKDRSYVLTGLMKSEGNSGATFRLERADGTVLATCVDSLGNPLALTKTTPWFDAAVTVQDVIRYRAPTYKAVGAVPETVYVVLRVTGVTGSAAWFDAIKLEESTVATPWSPGAVGATIADAGGIQIDGSKGGVFRYKGVAGTPRGYVEGGPAGLVLGTDTELTAPAEGVLAVEGIPVSLDTHAHAPRVIPSPVRRVYYPAGNYTWTKPAGLSHIEVEVVGGGGGSGGSAAAPASAGAAAGGGGGGGWAKKLFLASDLTQASYAIVVGAGGTGGSATPTAGGTGGPSSFSGTGITTVQGNPGQLGNSGGSTTTANSAGGGAGGSGTGGDVNAYGGDGGRGAVVSGTRTYSGTGGGTVLGGMSAAASGAAVTGSPYGGGAGGATTGASGSAAAGAAGAAGVVIVTEFYL
jgi:hypothetical protein